MEIIVIAVVIVIILIAVFSGESEDRPDIGDPDRPASPDNPVSIPVQVARWAKILKAAAEEYGLDYTWLAGMLWVESYGDPAAKGSAGERGLMQIKDIAVNDLRENGYGEFAVWRTDPETNIRAGAAYLHLQLRPGRTAGNIREAVKAYNQGYVGKDSTEKKMRAAARYLEKVENRRNLFA